MKDKAKGSKPLHISWVADEEDAVEGVTQAIHKLHMRNFLWDCRKKFPDGLSTKTGNFWWTFY